jgi:hypothetical protein
MKNLEFQHGHFGDITSRLRGRNARLCVSQETIMQEKNDFEENVEDLACARQQQTPDQGLVDDHSCGTEYRYVPTLRKHVGEINVVEPVRLLDTSHYAWLPTCGVAQGDNLANIYPTAYDSFARRSQLVLWVSSHIQRWLAR